MKLSKASSLPLSYSKILHKQYYLDAEWRSFCSKVGNYSSFLTTRFHFISFMNLLQISFANEKRRNNKRYQENLLCHRLWHNQSIIFDSTWPQSVTSPELTAECVIKWSHQTAPESKLNLLLCVNCLWKLISWLIIKNDPDNPDSVSHWWCHRVMLRYEKQVLAK